MYPSLALNLLWSSNFHLLNAGITGIHYIMPGYRRLFIGKICLGFGENVEFSHIIRSRNNVSIKVKMALVS